MPRNLLVAASVALVGCWAVFSNGPAAADEEADAANESPSRYSDEVPGLTEPGEDEGDLPLRPVPLIELWQDYVNQGPYEYEFELPTGMVVSPGLVLFGNANTGLEYTDNGTTDPTTELVTHADLFLNLTLSGTERILLGMSPTTRESGAKSRYTLGPTSGWVNESRARLSTAFFEGELSEMFPKLDMGGFLPMDWEIAFGRQAVLSQAGVLINDSMDSLALTRSTIPYPGTSFARLGGLVAVNGVHRKSGQDDIHADLFALFSEAQFHHSTAELDLVYVESDRAKGDQFNIGGSFIRQYIIFDHAVDTTTRIAQSYTPDEETAHTSNGTLLYSSMAFAPKRTDNILYINSFGALNSYAPAAGAAPLGIVGLLFSGNGLAGAAINSGANDAYGGSIGYQMFFSGALRSNLIIEAGGKVDNTSGGVNRAGAQIRYSQAWGRRLFFEVGGYGVAQESMSEGYGIRTKINVIF
ncbi:MAG: hypothetical protein QF894_04700 [Alphaproteobacteria bacterium]|nr:hypothetical protein [Alphaproteobacteria bacterium]